MVLRELLVVIPHSGIVIPGEISLDALSAQFPRLLRNVDWYTNWLYDFRDLLDNRHIVFPYCSLLLEGNRHPARLDDSVPLVDVHKEPIYRQGHEPDDELRGRLAAKYLLSFHKAIEDSIAAGATFLFDGHSTVTAHGVAENQIDVMNFQHSELDAQRMYYCPDAYIETYAAALQKRLPEAQVTINDSEYYTVYGHVCAAHSVNTFNRTGNRVPAFLQETNEALYKNADRTPNVEALNRLRRAFAESLCEMHRRVSERRTP